MENLFSSMAKELVTTLTSTVQAELDKQSLNLKIVVEHKVNNGVDRLYSVDEVAKIMKTEPTAIRNLIKNKKLDCLNLRGTKIRASEIERFYEESKNKDVTAETYLDNNKKIRVI